MTKEELVADITRLCNHETIVDLTRGTVLLKQHDDTYRYASSENPHSSIALKDLSDYLLTSIHKDILEAPEESEQEPYIY